MWWSWVRRVGSSPLLQVSTPGTPSTYTSLVHRPDYPTYRSYPALHTPDTMLCFTSEVSRINSQLLVSFLSPGTWWYFCSKLVGDLTCVRTRRFLLSLNGLCVMPTPKASPPIYSNPTGYIPCMNSSTRSLNSQ